MDSYSERWFLTYEHFYFVIKNDVHKAFRIFIYLFIYLYFMTLLSNYLYPGFFFVQIIV